MFHKVINDFLKLDKLNKFTELNNPKGFRNFVSQISFIDTFKTMCDNSEYTHIYVYKITTLNYINAVILTDILNDFLKEINHECIWSEINYNYPRESPQDYLVYIKSEKYYREGN